MATLWILSPYQLCEERYDNRGNLYMTEYEPFTYEDLSDNIEHEVEEGDTWDSIAHKYWAPIFQAGCLWRYVADFQPDPVVDPFLKLRAGTIIVVPSRTTLYTKIISNERRRIVD